MYVFLNANRDKKLVGDCVVRAISTLLGQDWNTTYLGIAVQGYVSADMPSGNSVWGDYLIYKGFEKRVIRSDCPNCLTVREFAELNGKEKYLLVLDGHVVTVIDGNYYDTWDSGDKVILYYFQKQKKPSQ